ncbi:MAG TPA: adenylate/guanylate cyclase domain-containing protein [Gaiellaceae bacterium]|nr:adenylate/guanylate cyclase domain-containing protein [Gaiellaceae bacterium]
MALVDPGSPDEMLKLVTVLFADAVGSTARAERMHPEDTRALMADYFAAMAVEIEAEGGTIAKFVGDAIMVVFGVPTAHEDDALRAVRAARRMLVRLLRWNGEREEAERIEVRIGINTGEVIAAGASVLRRPARGTAAGSAWRGRGRRCVAPAGAEGFRQLGAVWEEAWSRVLAAETLLAVDGGRARDEAARALTEFERLRSVEELERARRVRDRVAV